MNLLIPFFMNSSSFTRLLVLVGLPLIVGGASAATLAQLRQQGEHSNPAYSTTRTCTHSSYVVGTETGYRSCGGRVRPFRPFSGATARVQSAAAFGTVDENGVVKQNSNVIGWQNSQYAQNPSLYGRGASNYNRLSAREKQIWKQSQPGAAGAGVRNANLHPGDRYVIQPGYAVPREDWTGAGDVRTVKAYWQQYDAERSVLVGRPVTSSPRVEDNTVDYGEFLGGYDAAAGRFIPPVQSSGARVLTKTAPRTQLSADFHQMERVPTQLVVRY